MTKSPLFGRRIHISGSVIDNLDVASSDDVAKTRDFVTGLVKALLKRGANFVIPVDAEPLRKTDGAPVCFDWLVWETIHANLSGTRRQDVPGVLIKAVQHYKTETQIPEKYRDLWKAMRGSEHVDIHNASFWNMAAQRMEAQAQFGDILIPIGGAEGVLYLTNLYNEAGKPVVPVNAAVCMPTGGARRLYTFGQARKNTNDLFRTTGAKGSHAWLNLVNFETERTTGERVEEFVELLEALERPRAFAVRLLDPKNPEYSDVQNFFDYVVKPVLEDDLGYTLTVVDGRQAVEYSRIDEEIFKKLHKSRVVIADITASRPNCFLELGYALGRSVPTVVTAKEGTDHPFDIKTLGAFHWNMTGDAAERRRAFREHWDSIQNRAPLVSSEPLIQ